MMQVYDRVISSGSHVTLLMLTLLLLVSFAALAGLDSVRGCVLTRASMRLDRLLAARVVAATIETATRGVSARNQPLRDFDTVRQFVTGSGVTAVFDLPWAPLYILCIVLLHPALGLFAFFSALVLIGFAVGNEYWTRSALREANDAAGFNYAFTEMSLRNAQAIQAMGMLPRLLQRWAVDRDLAMARQQTASERSATMSAAIKFLRLSMQSLILGLGAYLVIERQAGVGAIFAASILLGRALQPVEQIVASWRSFVAAKESFGRLSCLLEDNPQRTSSVALPRLEGRLSAEHLSYVIPGASRPILYDVAFQTEPGEVICIVGPSGAGKSTLARHIVGLLHPSAGAIRLDGASIPHQPRDAIGSLIGYLPQDIELFAETVAGNISRFAEGDDAKIVEAARIAGVHDMILRLPDGYGTHLGDGAMILSGGYRQRIALARAVYGNPSLIVLDEPSSNLDHEGDVALANCVREMKRRGATIVMISHRPATIGLVDKIMFMRNGMVDLFGPRDEVMRRLAGKAPIHVVAGAAASS